jgi:hypothetical protein
MMLRKKLMYNMILMRTALLGGLLVVWPAGRRVLYISMINDATMEENKVTYKVIVSNHDVNAKSAINVAPHQENH